MGGSAVRPVIRAYCPYIAAGSGPGRRKRSMTPDSLMKCVRLDAPDPPASGSSSTSTKVSVGLNQNAPAVPVFIDWETTSGMWP